MTTKQEFYKWCGKLLPHTNGVLLKKYNAETEEIEYIPYQYHTDKQDIVISYLLEFELDTALQILFKNGKDKSVKDSYELYQALIQYGKNDYKLSVLHINTHIQSAKNKSMVTDDILEFQEHVMRLFNL